MGRQRSHSIEFNRQDQGRRYRGTRGAARSLQRRTV
jgi:hypothetical protein